MPVAGMRLSPDGRHVAILLPSQELDGPDQLWLYRVADRKLTAVTPRPDTRAKHPAAAVALITSFAWREGTSFAVASLWGDGSDGEGGPRAFYAATVAGCASREQAARETLAQTFTCPIKRVTATKVHGVHWSEVQRRANPVPNPPAEIRADPIRFSQWTENHHAPFSPGFDHNYEGFRAAGCGHAVDYLCFCPLEAPIAKQAACHCEAPSVPLLPAPRNGETQ